MSIKQSIAALFLLMSVSFSAQSETLYQIYSFTPNYAQPTFVYNGVYSLSYIQSATLTSTYGDEITNCYVNNGSLRCKQTNNGETRQIGNVRTVSSCPAGQELNSDGLCEEPPPAPFCSQASTQQQMRDFESSCFDDGGSPTIICNDQVEPPDFRMSCDIAPPPPTGCEPGSPSFPGCLDDENKCDENHPDWDPRYGMCCSPENNYCDVPPPESCTIFSVNWPECSGDTSIDPPDSGDLGDPSFPDGGASGGNGSGSTDSNKPQPDVDNTSDELSAIKSMNDDLNSQLNAINNDMNKNQAETKSALDALKASTDLNTQSVLDGANHVADAIDGQSGMLSGIGNKTNQYLKSINSLLNNGFGELTNGFDGISTGLEGLSAINENGFGDVIEAIEGISAPPIDIHVGDSASPLYGTGQFMELEQEVLDLKAEYNQILDDYRSYFAFNQSVNSGQFESHNIDLNWHGTAINQTNQVMASMRDNAGIISAVVLFVFGMLGIRSISGAF